jgi:hypothetical protein
MSVRTVVPLTITPEAAARVAELNVRAELDRMIEHARQVVDGLQRIDVELAEPYDTGSEPGVSLIVTKEHPGLADDPTGRQWGAWMVQAFPPEVCQHFSFQVHFENGHAG